MSQQRGPAMGRESFSDRPQRRTVHSLSALKSTSGDGEILTTHVRTLELGTRASYKRVLMEACPKEETLGGDTFFIVVLQFKKCQTHVSCEACATNPPTRRASDSDVPKLIANHPSLFMSETLVELAPDHSVPAIWKGRNM